MICSHQKAGDSCLKLVTGEPIKGFNTDPEDLETLIEPARKGLDLPRACNIMVALGRRMNQSTIIFLRVDRNNEILWDIAYEFCLPCPTTCPVDFMETVLDPVTGTRKPNAKYVCNGIRPI